MEFGAGVDLVGGVDSRDVLCGGAAGEFKGGGDLGGGLALEEEGFDLGAGALAAFAGGEELGVRALEFGGQGVAVGDVFLGADALDGGEDVGRGHEQVAGDAGDGPAVEDAAADLVAAGGFAVGLGVEGALARGGEGVGSFDFVAEEEAVGEIGDQVVPGVGGGAGEELDAVAVVAGEGWQSVGVTE